MKVYCCFSLYNLYIAVAKAMVQNEKIDLVIGCLLYTSDAADE